MDEEFLINELKRAIGSEIPKKKDNRGRKSIMSNDQLIEAIFLCP